MTVPIKNIFIAIALIIGTIQCNPNSLDIDRYYGIWTVKKYKFGNAISAFDDNQASKYISQQVIITKDQITVFGDECKSPIYKIREAEKENYLYENFKESDFSVIPISKFSVNEIKCNINPTYKNPDSLNFNFDLIFLNEREMIIPINGAYFYLEKEKAKERELSFKEFNGAGDFRQKVDLISCNALITIDYNFFSVPDKILLEDAQGKVFCSTAMEITAGNKTISTDLKLKDQTECFFYLKVESSKLEKSKWEIKIKILEY